MPAGPQGPLPSHDELIAQGKALRGSCPRAGHDGWSAPADRRDPLALIEESNQGRPGAAPHPVRAHAAVALHILPRGAAAIMAADLARTPASASCVQACEDMAIC